MPISRGEAVVLPVVCFLTGFTGPFGTYSRGLPHRLVFWTLVVVISVLMAGWFTRLAHRLVGLRRPWLRDLVIVGLMTAFFTPVLIGLSVQLMDVKVASLDDMVTFPQFVAIISLCVTTSRRIITRRWPGASRTPVSEADAAAEPSSPEPAPQARLMRRLPDGFEGPILRLAVEDHFVDVIAPGDTQRLRMRFADAIDEMDPIEGFCTHRSHWVAREAVERVDREGGRLFVVLTNGDRVPVSRTYRPRVEQAGLI